MDHKKLTRIGLIGSLTSLFITCFLFMVINGEQGRIDYEVQQALKELDSSNQSEIADGPVLFGIAPLPDKNGHYDDPHDDPVWHRNRDLNAKEFPICMVKGCKIGPKGNAQHHFIAADYCKRSGHYEMAISQVNGQKFFTLCPKHHAEIGHGIGHGGNWHKFNLDLQADVDSGKWNSRGKSPWKFTDDDQAFDWIKQRVKEYNDSVPNKLNPK